ncbi:MAG: ABC transporter ATP-binding protein [Firmicutes bacterium]|nr:ABC transporter ATP-binding protein [Candidatus Fiminaster equi]
MASDVKLEKTKNRLGDMVKSFKKYYIPFVVTVVLLVASVVLSILTPGKIQSLTDTMYNAIATGLFEGAETVVVPMNEVLTIVITLICFIVGSFICAAISGFVLNTIIQHYSRDIRKNILKKVNVLPLNYFDTKQIGDILSVVTNDVDTLSTSLQNSISMLIEAAVTLVGVIIAMFISCWQMAIAVLCSLPLMLAVLLVTFKFATPYFNKTQKVLGEVNAVVEENFSGQIVVKAFNAEDRKISEFKEENEILGKFLYGSQVLGGIIEPAMSLISYLTYAAILIVGGLLVAKGTINPGAITGFLVYVSIFQKPLAELGQIGSTMQLGIAACNRVFTFLSEEELPDESYKPAQLDTDHIVGNVEFQDVCFGYDPSKLTIKHFSQKIQPGMKVAIIGPTGAGKTTLVNLLMRFYETTSGDILIDGKSIHDMQPSELRKVFGMILQETWVINGTLRENIVYNLQNVSEERLNQILEETNLKHFVETLPEGIDTVIQKESALSAGQKQLVTIARAMAENAPMLILDEATSNVDTRTEILIQNAMDSLTKGRTSFVIAHRLSTIKNADLIIAMKDGNVVETGNHDSLMKLNGLYAELYNSQFNK